MREPVDCLAKSVGKSFRQPIRECICECICKSIGKSICFKFVRLAQPVLVQSILVQAIRHCQPLTDADGLTDFEPASTGHGLEHVIGRHIPIPKPVPLLERPAIDESVPFGEPFRVPLVQP